MISTPLPTLIQQQQIAGYHIDTERPHPAPRLLRRFTIWNGVTINRAYRTLQDVATAVWSLVPPGAWDEVEWLVKAGEAGTYQATWDPHPLAIDGPGKLQALRNAGQAIGLAVTPYVVVRGNPSWRPAEVAQVRSLAQVSGRVVLNLEPGSAYAHPAICTPGGADRYMRDLGLPADQLELCAIPRATQVNELGRPQTLSVWLSYVGSASWECYDGVAGGVGPDSLRPDVALPRVSAMVGGLPPEQLIPLVQRNRIGAWADTEWAAPGVEVWHLDGNL